VRFAENDPVLRIGIRSCSCLCLIKLNGRERLICNFFWFVFLCVMSSYFCRYSRPSPLFLCAMRIVLFPPVSRNHAKVWRCPPPVLPPFLTELRALFAPGVPSTLFFSLQGVYLSYELLVCPFWASPVRGTGNDAVSCFPSFLWLWRTFRFAVSFSFYVCVSVLVGIYPPFPSPVVVLFFFFLLISTRLTQSYLRYHAPPLTFEQGDDTRARVRLVLNKTHCFPFRNHILLGNTADPRTPPIPGFYWKQGDPCVVVGF